MNSSVAFCASAAFADVSAERTIIPSSAVIVQAVCGLGIPSTSHRHIRHAPIGGPGGGPVADNGESVAGRGGTPAQAGVFGPRPPAPPAGAGSKSGGGRAPRWTPRNFLYP